MKINTVKGTNDYLPEEMRLRDYLQDVILKTYQSCGFVRISTPILEDAENLDKSDGGENLNLIFKVLKRGEKLEKALAAGDEAGLADLGLRYDLTLPLSRYYANNRAKLLTPFKCIQMDRVYRAERPQKGRLREFVQCDIDIIGDSSVCAELQLMTTTAEALRRIGMTDFKMKVNDRRILRAVLLACGFAEETLDGVCIGLDKLDKIGSDGVAKELAEKEYPVEAIEKLGNILSDMPVSIERVREIIEENQTSEENQGRQAADNLEHLLSMMRELSGGQYDVVFDLSLVRGQGYYTGTVFEVENSRFKGAIAGGGRYDNLIGKFLGENVPAVGFSIGFERIFSILMETGAEIPDRKQRVAVLCWEDQCMDAMKQAAALRAQYDTDVFVKPKKVGKFIDRLKAQGYDGIWQVGQSEEVKQI
ncbi:MAG: histidine--tRNA ligase [Lachnospiraceae bacterium]|nr:histidine--tRNA ligase [Lachnospiraceae bacterium]